MVDVTGIGPDRQDRASIKAGIEEALAARPAAMVDRVRVDRDDMLAPVAYLITLERWDDGALERHRIPLAELYAVAEHDALQGDPVAKAVRDRVIPWLETPISRSRSI
jgi:hypothetical protein